MTARIKATLPLAIAIGVLAFAWTEFSLNFTFHWFTAGDLGNGLALPNNFHLILPAAFVSWGFFFAAGADNAALVKVVAASITGGLAALATMALSSLTADFPDFWGIALWVGVFALVLVVLTATGDWHYVPATFGAFAAVFFWWIATGLDTGSRTEAASATAWKLSPIRPPPVPGPSVVSCRRPTHGCGSTSRSPCSAAVSSGSRPSNWPASSDDCSSPIARSPRRTSTSRTAASSRASRVDLHRRQVPRPASRCRRLAGDRASVHGGERAEPDASGSSGRAGSRAQEYVLVEAFAHEDAGTAHVMSAHFRDAQQDLPPHLAETPRIVNVVVPGTEWSLLGELAVDAS